MLPSPLDPDAESAPAGSAPAGSAPAGTAPAYPTTRTGPEVDSYHGTDVPDPYRWLEDDMAPETTAWVGAQNAVTERWLAQHPWRDALRRRITRLVDYPRMGQPHEQAGWLLVARNDGLQNQSVWYAQRGPDGPPVVLLDPNALSDEGTTRIGAPIMNRAGTHVAYAISHAGSDWQQIRIRALDTRLDLDDVVSWVKVSDIAWWKDGFFYSRYPEPGAHALSEVNEGHQVWYHQLGTSQEHDRLVFEDPDRPQRFHTLGTTRDERFAVLYISDRGTGQDGEALSLLALDDVAPSDHARFLFQPIWTGFDDQFRVIDAAGDSLLVYTTRHAPNGRVVRIDPATPDEAAWHTVLAEREEPLQDVATGGGQLFALYLHDVITRVRISALDGTSSRDITLPGLGTASGFDGEPDARHVYFTYTSFTAPPTVYRYALASGTVTRFQEPTLPFDPSAYETQQVFATSRDGTRVPMFLVYKKGRDRDQRHPTLLYGYGGFNVSLFPNFSAARIAFLEQGGVYAQANLRGGGEYGDAWHKQGIKAHKQNVFDDAIACAEWLIDNGWTTRSQLAIQGGSNGGLLVGALMTQRPDLFAVALPSVGVLDMLRFHKFTIGWNWIADYGSSDDPEGFRLLHAYSPLHQLRPGTAYPATLISTGDHDDRVVPAHSFKFAAALQAAHHGAAPVLLRIETQSGHGSSSLRKAIEELTDVYTFVFANLGVTPQFPDVNEATPSTRSVEQ